MDDLDTCLVAIHYPKGYVLYEDQLRAELNRRDARTRIFEPADFQRFVFGNPIVLLMPALRYPADKRQYARPLDWGGGIRAGLVIKPGCRAAVREYALAVQACIRQQGSPWAMSEASV